jgi:large subunit ribosomal protein L24
MDIHRNDTVLILSGKDRGKRGTVERILAKTEQVVVGGVNIMKKHAKPSKKYPSGGIIEIAYPIHQSKVKIVDAEEGKPAKKSTVKKDK